MKIYIWEDVLCDYSCGMAVAYAPTLEAALDTFTEDYIVKQLGRPTHIIDCENDTTAQSFWANGGG